jgi:hypothetical protein
MKSDVIITPVPANSEYIPTLNTWNEVFNNWPSVNGIFMDLSCIMPAATNLAKSSVF